MNEINTANKPIKNWASDLEDQALQQIINVANLPFIYHHVAVMPDAHAGFGSTIGTVMATKGAIIPSAVGVDIGCGMAGLKLPLKVDELKKLTDVRHSIERSIPVGRNGNRDISDRAAKTLADMGLPPSIREKNKLYKNASHQFGSLGGGNHFIEICTDQVASN